MEPNFSGFVSKANLQCTDGRTILSDAFAHQDGAEVPLVYNHVHDDINAVLGTVKLKNIPGEGLWGDVYLNPESGSAKTAGQLVHNRDIRKFSVWAKDLVERGLDVLKGTVQEVSLVLGGANPGANIANYDNVLAHSGMDPEDVLLVIGGEITHADGQPIEKPAEEKPAEEKPAEEKPAEEDADLIGDALSTLNDDQRKAVNQVIADTVEEAVTEALTKEALEEEPAMQHSDNNSSQKGNTMPRSAFDRSKTGSTTEATTELKHSDMQAVLLAAKGNPSGGIRDFNENNAVGSLREFIRSDKGRELMHADTYGLDNIEVLFPDAQALMNTPKFIDRRQEWVKTFLNGTSHSPFSRVKTLYADITADEARARGYIKGNQKVEEVFPIFKRTTGPAWIYKKQKLDRQDIIDITDFDVVAWMKVEMRGKLDEEIARAGLFGDGRPVMIGGDLNPDKIPEPTGTSGDGIRSVYNDDDLYTSRFSVPMPADPTSADYNGLLDTVTEAGEHYRGSGNKTAFVSYRTATKLLTIRDGFEHRVYKNLSEVAGDMDVNSIQKVPTELMPEDCLAIVLDLADYNFGTNRGGEVTLFDDFDIDVNQYKYLMETYLSGALVLPYSAQVFMSVPATDTLVIPAPLAFTNPDTVEYVAQPGVVYKRTDTGATLALDVVLLEGESVEVEATPAAGYYFESDLDAGDTWLYEYGDPTTP